MEEALGLITMNPTVPTTVAGNLVSKWGRFATAAIVQTVVVVPHLRMRTDPRPHPTRCRLSRRIRVLGAREGVKETHVADFQFWHELFN